MYSMITFPIHVVVGFAVERASENVFLGTNNNEPFLSVSGFFRNSTTSPAYFWTNSANFPFFFKLLELSYTSGNEFFGHSWRHFFLILLMDENSLR